MRKLLILLFGVVINNSNSFGQPYDILPKTKIMTLGVFHFAYPNLDAVKTEDKDKISVLEEPYHSEIIAISKAICDYKPTIIAIEATPDEQFKIDTLYSLYKNMYLAIFQLFALVIFIVTNHFIANAAKKLYTFLSISFTLISSTVLLIAYFTQFSVVPISVMKGETEGIALITQYNEHGLFIALEELGYITMSIALFFLAFAFSKNTRAERIIRIILISQLFLTILAFIIYSIRFGIERSYLFEVATITINWLVIIIVGFMIGVHYSRSLDKLRSRAIVSRGFNKSNY